MKKLIKENFEMRGTVKVRGYKGGTFAIVLPMLEKVKELKRSGKLASARLIEKKVFSIMKKNRVGKEIINHNLIMTGANTGRDLIIQALNGYMVSPVYYSAINYGAIGTGSTTPAAGDLTLVAEVARTPMSWSQDVSFNELQMQFFFADGVLANTTYYEFGTFIAGSSSLNSGQIFNRALFGSPYVKETGVDTTIEVDISL